MIEQLIKEISLEYLQNSEIGANLLEALQGIEKAQETMMAYINDDSPDYLKMLRVGTIATFGILSKLVSGKSIKDFDSNDWKDIANNVANYAILIDGQQYSVMIFEAYADYVDISVKLLEVKGISQEKCDAIRLIAQKVRSLSEELAQGKISEVDYTEQCLWLLLETMIKLLAAYSAIAIGKDGAEFAESVAMLAFEYGRYSLYKQELELINQYLEHQEEVDAELEDTLSLFKDQLQDRIDVFDSLIEDAFSPDISERLKSSVEIARNVGVAESEILDSVEKIDDFFM